MTGAVKHGERGAWVLVEQLPSPAVADTGVLSSGHEQRWPSVWSLLLRWRNEFPPLTDPCKCGRVGQRASGFDVPLVSIQVLGSLDREVVAELGAAVAARTDHDIVFRHVVDAWQQRAQQCQSDYLLRPSAGDRLRKVGTRRVSGDQHRFVANDSVDERQQDFEDIVSTSDRFWSDGASHTR